MIKISMLEYGHLFNHSDMQHLDTECQKHNVQIDTNLHSYFFSKESYLNSIEEIKSLDGLQDGSITLGILQNIGKIKTPNCTHLKGFFSVETSNKFSTNNIILETVLFGKTDEQREKLKKIIDNQEHKYSILKKDITACYYSYFGQSVLNDQEKQNFYELLKGILI